MKSLFGAATLLIATAAPAGPAPPPGAQIPLSFTRGVANIEYDAEPMSPRPSPDSLRLPRIDGTAWHGRIIRRLSEDVADQKTDHFVPFVAEYQNGVAVRAWYDANFNGDLTDAPPVPLSAYPAVAGARSFLAKLNWTGRTGDRAVPIEQTIRVVLEPEAAASESGTPVPAPPRYRMQMVFAMLGTATLQGKPHHVFLLDGDGDGFYTRGLLDGLFVDLDDDGHFVVDQMDPEYGSFEVPFTMGGTSYQVTSLDPEGRSLGLRSLGPGPEPAPPPSVGASAPDFSFTSVDGRLRRLSDYRGRLVLVYFWASWCRTCTFQADRLKQIYDRFHPGGLEILGISYDTDRLAMEKFRTDHGQPWPTSFSGHQLWEDPIGRLYREHGTGVFYLVDPAGVVQEISSVLDQIEPWLHSPKSDSPG